MAVNVLELDGGNRGLGAAVGFSVGGASVAKSARITARVSFIVDFASKRPLVQEKFDFIVPSDCASQITEAT